MVQAKGRNLVDYCHKQKYELIVNLLPQDTEGCTPNDLLVKAGFDNIQTILNHLETRPDVDAVFQIGSDAIITNTDIKLEDLMKPYEKFDIVTGSDRAGISASQMFVRNTSTAKRYLKDILEGIASGAYLHDQDYMWKNRAVFVFPTLQRVMNSYDSETRLEPIDKQSTWHEGDFLVHLAGIPIDQRMKRLDFWLSKVK